MIRDIKKDVMFGFFFFEFFYVMEKNLDNILLKNIHTAYFVYDSPNNNNNNNMVKN